MKKDSLKINGKYVKRAKINGGLYYESGPWYSEYGVLADYVISNGVDNWVDTKLPLNTFKDGVVIEMDIEYLTITSVEINAMGAVSGSGSSRNVIEAGSIVNGNQAFYSYTSNAKWSITNFVPQQNKRYNLRYEFRSGLQIMFVDGVESYRTTDSTNITSGAVLTLFARNYNDARSGFANIKWRSFKMSKLDGTPIVDYMPLYVSKKPILDQTGNEYAVGSYILADNVNKKATILYGEAMEGYARWWKEIGVQAEYLRSDGNAYVDTGYTLQYNNGTTEIGVSVENTTTAPSIYGFIERSGDIGNRIAAGSTSSGLFVGAGNTVYLTEPTIENQKYDIVWNRKTSKTLLDGIEISTSPGKTSGNTYPAYLFSRNDRGKPDADGIYNLIGNVYYLREILDDVVQFSYIPIQVTKEFTDLKGVTHNVGSYIMVNELSYKDVPTHYGTFSGVINRELQWFETVPSSTGIRTNFVPTNATASLTKIEISCSFTSGNSGYLVNGIGGGPTMYIGMNPSSRLAYGNLASDSSIAQNLSYDTYYKLVIDYKNKTLLINDEVVASNIVLYPYNRSNVNFGLNCYVNTVSGAIFNNWGQKTQYCKIYVDDVLTHHWVGQLNKGVTDIYDKIGQVYLSELGLIEGQEHLIAGALLD